MTTSNNTAETLAPAFVTEAPSGTRRRIVSSRALSLAALREQAREACQQHLGAEFAPQPREPAPPPSPRPRPAPSPEPHPTRRRRVLVQQELFPVVREPPKRVLRLIGNDTVREPYAGCLDQATGCAHLGCRMHLGGPRSLDGHVWRCALDVANAYPGGLSPRAVAALDDSTEGEVLREETSLLRRYPSVRGDLVGLRALLRMRTDEDARRAHKFVANNLDPAPSRSPNVPKATNRGRVWMLGGIGEGDRPVLPVPGIALWRRTTPAGDCTSWDDGIAQMRKVLAHYAEERDNALDAPDDPPADD